jgi:hypothetical protein
MLLPSYTLRIYINGAIKRVRAISPTSTSLKPFYLTDITPKIKTIIK